MSKPAPLSVSVTRTIHARPDTVYDLISDITRMSTFSPETTSAQWLSGADHAAVGARFKGTNAIGRTRWSTKPTVTAAERGVGSPSQCRGGPVPSGSTCSSRHPVVPEVTESMSQSAASPALIRLLRRAAGVTDREEHLRQGMITTLDRLAAAAVNRERELTQL